METAMGRTSKRDARLERQREYQRRYRRRLKNVGRPDRDAIAQAFFYHVITQILKDPKAGDGLKRLMDQVASFLVDLGYDPTETHYAIDAVLSRYEQGWNFQRKRF